MGGWKDRRIGGWTDGRMGGWVRRFGILLGAAVALSAYPPIRLSAQVGHDPANSPYRDIRLGMGLVFYGGYMNGGRGAADVGITNATVFGGRYELPIGSVLRLSIGMGMARGERYIVDPNAPAETRKSGPVPDGAVFVEAQAQGSVTGGKTWHKLAPFVNLTGGVAYGGDEPSAEPSAYRFGTKLYYGGGAGVRWFATAHLSLAADVRVLSWRLKYPPQYYVTPAGSTPVLALGQASDEPVRQPWMRLGLGWTF